MMGVALHPRDPDQVYGVSRCGQIFGTRDGGRSWREYRFAARLRRHLRDRLLLTDEANLSHRVSAVFARKRPFQGCHGGVPEPNLLPHSGAEPQTIVLRRD